MRLVVRLLGFDILDIHQSDDTPADDWADLSGGTLTSLPVGFTQPEPGIEYEDE